MKNFRSILAILLMLAMLLPAMTVPLQAASGPQAICVPWQPASPDIPHYSYTGASITLKGIARGGATQYYWEFGDGSPSTAWTNISNSYNLGVAHTYTGVVGQLFIATLHVKDAGGNQSQDQYPVKLFASSNLNNPVELDVRINMAIDAGLWYLHNNLNRGTYGSGSPGYSQPYGYWTAPNYGGYEVASTGAALDALQMQGVKVNGDYDGNPYVEDVQRAINYLLYNTFSYPISNQPAGNPDTNGNGIGLWTGRSDAGQWSYVGGIGMVALASCGAPNYKAPVGTPNVYDRYLKDILQDEVDLFAWGQTEAAYGGYRGGWRYNWNTSSSDMSTTQWAVLGMMTAEDNMGSTIPAFVRTELAYFVNYVHYMANNNYNGGYGYDGPSSYLNLTKAAAGVICQEFMKVPLTDTKITATMGYIYRHWGDTGTSWNDTRLFGNSYGMYGVMKSLRIPEPDITRVTEYDYNNGVPTANSFDWYYTPSGQTQTGMASYIVSTQQSDGGWDDNVGSNPVYDSFATGWRILCLLKGVTTIPPVAQIANSDKLEYDLNQSITLDGSLSHHPDPIRNIVSYEWDLDNDGLFDDASGVTATITGGFPAQGHYPVSLRVSDDNPVALGGPQTDTVVVSIFVHPPCLDPHANTGGPYLGSPNVPITLDASASWDSDSTTLFYDWDMDGDGIFDDANGIKPAYTWTTPGVYSIALKVTDDGCSLSSEFYTGFDIAYTTVEIGNHDPISKPGGPYQAKPGHIITLDGSGSSDPDGDPITFSWDLDNDGSFGDSTTVTTPFTLGSVIGTVYTVALKVTDSYGAYKIAYASITVVANQTPIANAGPDQTVYVGATVSLNGSGSTDANGDPLTYSWSLISMPAGSAATLNSPITVNPTFVADKFGSYVVQLIVNDGEVNSAPDTVTITTANSAPIANAGPDQTVNVGATTSLNGSGSSDVDGDPLTYSWSFVSKPAGSAATLNNPILVNPTFIVDKSGSYVVQLIVNDGKVNSAPDTVTITTANSTPIANAGPDQTVNVGATTSLNGSGSSDVDGDPLTYSWSFVSKPAGSAATLNNPILVNPTFIVDKSGSYVLQLIVNDGKVNSAPDTVTITTANSAPIANAGPDQTVNVGATTSLNGSGSSDVDGDPLTYSWSFASKPAGSAATLSDPIVLNPTFVADKSGTYVVQLIVNDGKVNSAPDTVIITTFIAGGSGQAISLSKEAVVGSNGTTVTCTVVIENHASSGYPLTIESVYDLVYHYSAGTDNVTIVPTAEYPVFTLAAGDNATLTFTYEKATDDEDQEVVDTIVATGYHTSPSGKHIFAGAIESATITFPVPELSAGILFGLGALGLAGFILLRRKNIAAKT